MKVFACVCMMIFVMGMDQKFSFKAGDIDIKESLLLEEDKTKKAGNLLKMLNISSVVSEYEPEKMISPCPQKTKLTEDGVC